MEKLYQHKKLIFKAGYESNRLDCANLDMYTKEGGEYLVKKIFAFIFVFAALALVAQPVMAGGDKVRGEEAAGDATRVCATPDFVTGDCPYGDYTP